MTAPQSESDVPGGEEFGKYTIYGKIAAGGMAAVYLGRERAEPRRWVAIKRVHQHLVSRPDVVQMFLNEARIVSRLEHPNICGIIHFGVQEGSPYIVMRYLHGAPLSGLLRRIVDQKMDLPVDLMAYICASILEGLHYAHDATGDDGQPIGLVHRDISPQNIFITFEGEIALLDFGVAKAAGYAGYTRTGHIKGKYAYMSPEQVEAHPLDRRSDVFSLGIVLWESLAGKHLFRRRRHIDTLRAIANADVPSIAAVNHAVPHALEAIVGRALVGDRRLRYQTAKAMASDLYSYLQQKKSKMNVEEVSRTMKAMFPERRHPSETPGMRTQPEVLALVTETDQRELPSIADEPINDQENEESIASHTLPDLDLEDIPFQRSASIAQMLEPRDTLIPNEPEPPKPDSASEPTEQLDVVMIGDRLEMASREHHTGPPTIPIQLPGMSKSSSDSEDSFEDATIQLAFVAPPSPHSQSYPPPAPALPPNDARATIPDRKISLPPIAKMTFAQDTMIPAPTIVETPESYRPRPLIPEPVARTEKFSPVVISRKRSQTGPILAAALACVIGFAAYVGIVRWIRSPPAEPELVSPKKVAVAPRIVQREETVKEAVAPQVAKSVSRADLLKAREHEKTGRKALLNGDLLSAEEALLECTRLASIAACHRSLGVLYAKTGKGRASITHYKRYLELSPNAEDGDYVRKIISDAQ